MALDKINRALQGLVKEFSDRPLPTREAIAVWGSTQRLSRMEELEEAGEQRAAAAETSKREAALARLRSRVWGGLLVSLGLVDPLNPSPVAAAKDGLGQPAAPHLPQGSERGKAPCCSHACVDQPLVVRDYASGAGDNFEGGVERRPLCRSSGLFQGVPKRA